jgi:hypothetical protein
VYVCERERERASASERERECPLFVLTSSAMLATTSLLLLLGVIWYHPKPARTTHRTNEGFLE